MNRFLLFLSGLLFFSLSLVCDAAVLERDWKTPGDGLLTYDNVNQREWLDLSETLLEKFPDVSHEGSYQKVIAELSPGGMFDGFRVAKIADALGLAHEAGINTDTDDFSINGVATHNLIELLGPTRTTNVGRVQSRGFLDEILGPAQDNRRIEAIFDYRAPEVDMSFVGDAGLRYGPGDFTSPATTGVMLFRVVPEPSSVLLLFLLLSAAGLMHSRRNCLKLNRRKGKGVRTIFNWICFLACRAAGW